MFMEDLMKPRYKVIAYYPNSPFTVGEILTQDILPPYTDGNGDYELILYTNQTYSVEEWDVKESPANFKSLQWWEERKAEELPEYVKSNHSDLVIKVGAYTGQYFISDTDKSGKKRSICNYLPATKEEYELTKNGLLDGK